MPNTLSELKNDVLVKLGVSTTVAYYTDTIIDDWINEAHIWAAGYKKWPFTEGRISTTFASLVTDEDSNLRGEYPEGWKSDSIRLMRIEGKQLEKLNMLDFYRYLEDLPSNTGESSRVFTDYGRAYFVHPNIDLGGTVSLWGQYTPLDLDKTDPASPTIFSSTEEGNEAIVERVLSYAKTREKKLSESEAHSNRAKSILEELWNDIKAEGFGYHTKRNMFRHFPVVTGARDRGNTFREDSFF